MNKQQILDAQRQLWQAVQNQMIKRKAVPLMNSTERQI